MSGQAWKGKLWDDIFDIHSKTLSPLKFTNYFSLILSSAVVVLKTRSLTSVDVSAIQANRNDCFRITATSLKESSMHKSISVIIHNFTNGRDIHGLDNDKIHLSKHQKSNPIYFRQMKEGQIICKQNQVFQQVHSTFYRAFFYSSELGSMSDLTRKSSLSGSLPSY